MRVLCILLTILCATFAAAQAGDDGLTGTWRVVIHEGGATNVFWLLDLGTKDGKLAGKVIAAKGVPTTTLHDLRREKDLVYFTLRLGVQEADFEFRLPKAGAKHVLGSLTTNRQLRPVRLEATAEKA